MYIPAAFEETRPDVLHDFLRRFPFGLLVSPDGPELAATHLPFLFDPSRGPQGTLRAHFAKANPHWHRLTVGASVLVVFQGPHAYVSPAWYETALAVPTWNYAVVHARGRARVLEDDAELRRLLDDTVRAFEPAPAGPDGPGWSVERLPEAFVAKMAAQVVGFEVEVERIEGKFKLSQNRSPADRAGVVAALAGGGDSMESEVARLMSGS